jgi:LmbE family N-acetylglucosaminyl deacetylase
VLFSPHPDDETLACAGTILQKLRAGGHVKIVQMTDGQAATHNLVTRTELKERRRQEALNAGRTLGLLESDTYFLDFEDGRLTDHADAAAQHVRRILEKERPQEIFVPYTREPVSLAADHVATTNIVKMVLPSLKASFVIWEYPVWFWAHWPWVALRQRRGDAISTRKVISNSVRDLFGMRALLDLRYSVDIAHVLNIKRAAIAQHRSQVEKIIADERWIILQEIANGDFFACFDQYREHFRRLSFVGR